MAEQTGIEWTDHTFNPVWGCIEVSPGCQRCYARTLSTRYGHDVWGPAKTTPRRTFGDAHWAEPRKWNRKAERDGVRRRVFCGSMCDIFEDHPTTAGELARLWPLIRETSWLDWLLLTKRPENIRWKLPSDWGFPGYANAWLGTSIESQLYAWRAFVLCQVPARVHFISAEPLLGAVDLTLIDVEDEGEAGHFNALDGFYQSADGGRSYFAHHVDWVIGGGESGAGARPMELEWARSLMEQCRAFGADYFLKQLGGHPDKRGGEKALLDGRRWTQMPTPAVR